MKIITIKSPWAQAIVDLGKDIENRTWDVSYRGPLLIHCGKGRVTKKDLADLWPKSIKLPEIDPYDLGCIIGRVDLVDIVSHSDSLWALPTRYKWVLANPVRTKRVPCQGQLGLWDFFGDI